MVDFDIMQLSLSAKPIIDVSFLTNTANWELVTIRANSTKIIEVNAICQTINKQFNIKARS